MVSGVMRGVGLCEEWDVMSLKCPVLIVIVSGLRGRLRGLICWK
jgi:hypothetical protein